MSDVDEFKALWRSSAYEAVPYTNDFAEFGSLDNPIIYTIVKVVLDEVNKTTEIFVDSDIILTSYKGYYKSETKRGKSMLSGYNTGYTVDMDGKNYIENDI